MLIENKIQEAPVVHNLSDLHACERLSMQGKIVIIQMDGAADLPIPELGGKTPLEAANIPNIDALAASGSTGMMKTCFDSLPVGSVVANMGILGYNPSLYYPLGRASFEALAQDVFLDSNDIAFRCNLISLDDMRRISDFTAGQISNESALRIVDQLQINQTGIEVYAGQSYRNLLIVRNAVCSAACLECMEPHNNIGKFIDDILPKALTSEAEQLAAQMRALLLDSIDQIAGINKSQQSKADMLWLWSPSRTPHLPSFKNLFGLSGAVVAGLDFMRGIGIAAGMETKEISGATGYIDTDLNQKVRYAKNALQRNDLVFIHVNAPDEEGHAKNVANKIRAIERIDSEVVAPLFAFLEEKYPGNYLIAVLPDHPTLLSDGRHTSDPVPYLIYGKNVQADDARHFAEAEIALHCSASVLSYHFMDKLLMWQKWREE